MSNSGRTVDAACTVGERVLPAAASRVWNSPPTTRHFGWIRPQKELASQPHNDAGRRHRTLHRLPASATRPASQHPHPASARRRRTPPAGEQRRQRAGSRQRRGKSLRLLRRRNWFPSRISGACLESIRECCSSSSRRRFLHSPFPHTPLQEIIERKGDQRQRTSSKVNALSARVYSK